MSCLVFIPDFCVAVKVIICKTCQDLIISRIGEVSAVSDIHPVIQIPVAVKLAFSHDRRPEERHQLLSSFFRTVRPELLTERSEERRVGRAGKAGAGLY